MLLIFRFFEFRFYKFRFSLGLCNYVVKPIIFLVCELGVDQPYCVVFYVPKGCLRVVCRFFLTRAIAVVATIMTAVDMVISRMQFSGISDLF